MDALQRLIVMTLEGAGVIVIGAMACLACSVIAMSIGVIRVFRAAIKDFES